MTRSMLIATVVALAIPASAGAQASDNAIQPSPAYFGNVKAGNHPTKTLTVTNHTGRKQTIRRFVLAGAGGGKFTLTWKHATCRLGMRLRNGASCSVVVRVFTTFPDWWETNLQINYGPRLLGLPKRGQWNGVIFARVIA